MEEYVDSTAAMAVIYRALVDTIGVEAARAVGEQALHSYATNVSGTRELIVTSTRWVIRDDDLNILKEVAEGVKTAASGGLFGLAINLQEVGSLPPDSRKAVVGACVGVCLSILLLIRRMLRKGAKLDGFQIRVLSLLKSSKGLTLEEIRRKFGGNEALQEEGAFSSCLNSLQAIPIGDGTLVSLVSVDSKGVWRVAGI